MNRVIAISAGVAALAAAAAGCSSSASSKPSNPPPPPPASSSSPGTSTSAALHTESSKYGQILVDGSGRTLYVLTADTGSQSTCNGDCAAIWPPDTTTGTPTNSGVTASLVGTSPRMDHSTQVTYKGHPLYTYSKDSKAGDINGEGIATFGGIWYVVGTDGNAITAPSTQPSQPSTPAPSSPSSPSGGYNY